MWYDKGYFDELLNVGVGNEREEEGNLLEGREEGGMSENNEYITEEEVKVAINKMKKGKSAGLDGICGEMIQAGGDSMIKLLEKIFNECWKERKVPQDWQDACLVPLYKGKGDKMKCMNYRGISLLSVVGKIYGRVLIERVKAITEGQIGEEQGGFREGRGCVDQVFTLRMLMEKFGEKKRDLYVCFMDLEKVYDRVSRNKMWAVLEDYRVKATLLSSIKAFYKNSRACVRVCRKKTDFFGVGWD